MRKRCMPRLVKSMTTKLKNAWERNSISGQAYADLRSLTALKLQHGRFTETDWESYLLYQEEFAKKWEAPKAPKAKTNEKTIEMG